MLNCEHLVLLPKEGLVSPIPKHLIPCACPECGQDCYVARSWINKVQKKNPNAEVKCLECLSKAHGNKFYHKK